MNTFVASASMVSSFYSRIEVPSPSIAADGGAGGDDGVPVRRPMRAFPAFPEAKPKVKALYYPVVEPELYLHRHNAAAEALGKFRRIRRVGLDLFLSPDFATGAIPMGITSILIVANMALVWHQVGWWEYIFTLCMLFATFSSYLLTSTTDPGIYPRLRSGERDPLGDNTQLVFCKRCCLRRPPRCSHCYHCDVCVLEHDHHCSILGGCVGVRNVRWFALYLVTCCSSTMIGVVWLMRFLFYDLFVVDDAVTTSSPVHRPVKVRGSGERPSTGDDHSGAHLAALGVLLLDFVVVLLVGIMLCIYVYLTLTSTTRRELKRKEVVLGDLWRLRFVWRNFKKVLRPPSSLLHHQGDNEEKGEERSPEI